MFSECHIHSLSFQTVLEAPVSTSAANTGCAESASYSSLIYVLNLTLDILTNMKNKFKGLKMFYVLDLYVHECLQMLISAKKKMQINDPTTL